MFFPKAKLDEVFFLKYFEQQLNFSRTLHLTLVPGSGADKR